jgi:hypothetical protein
MAEELWKLRAEISAVRIRTEKYPTIEEKQGRLF